MAAYTTAMGIALGNMVANLSSHKRGWDDRWEEFSNWAEKGMFLQNELLALADEDTRAFKRMLDAFGMPKSTPRDAENRDAAIQEATRHAIQVPFKVMETGLKAMEIIKAMVLEGNPEYEHHFYATDSLSPSQKQFARSQWEQFRNWWSAWPGSST